MAGKTAQGTPTEAANHAEVRAPKRAALGGGKGKRGVRNYFDGGQPYIPVGIVECLVVIGTHATGHVSSVWAGKRSQTTGGYITRGL